MNFPISIIKIQDRIVLCQGEITSKFKKQISVVDSELNDLNEDVYEGQYIFDYDFDLEYDTYYIDIASYSEPMITHDVIRINGSKRSKNYNFVSCPYTEDTFNNLNDYLKKFINKFNEMYGTNYVYDNTNS